MAHQSLSPRENTGEIPAYPPGVQLTVLDQGLTLIVREDHSAPVVSAQAWCMAGSVHEGRWLGAGLSHVLEHMLFKGTTRRGPARIDQEVQEAGGYMNAYTSFDRTVFYINVPNTGRSVAVDILSDIMQNATLPPEELEREKEVIRREMDMNQDDPHRRASRRLFETAYTRSPYRYTVIGYPTVFSRVQREDILAYYHEKYAPNNLFFVVTGDFPAAQIEEQVREAFLLAKARPLPPEVLPLEPRQTAPREVIEEASVELGHLHFSWHIPDVRHPDVPLLDVLSTILGSGRSSRLYQQVREKQGLTQMIDAWTYSPGNPGLIGISAVCEAEKFNAARGAIQREIDRILQDGITEDEVAKAKKQFIAATLAIRKTMQGQAQDLGSNWMAAQDLNFSERYLAAVKRLHAGDLQQVARKYLTPENRTLYALLPKGATPAIQCPVEINTTGPIQKFDLAQGLRLLVKEDHRLPFVQFRAVGKGGVLAENISNNGVVLLLAKMLLQGTAKRTAEQIATEIESIGGHIDSYAGNNSLGLNAEVLSEDFDTGLELMADVLLRSAWPEPALDLEKQMQLAAIRAQKDHLLQSAFSTMRQLLFGKTGYGLDIHGTETSVQNLTVTNLKQCAETLLRPNNCVLAIYGDVNTDRVKAAVEEKFLSWAQGAVVLPSELLPQPLTEPRRMVEKRDKKQAVLALGFPGTTLHHEDRFALELIQEACSDLGSRLFLRIREKLGLAYYVGAQNFTGLAAGYFAFYAGTSPDKATRLEAEILQEIEALRRDGLTADELHRAQAKLLGQKKIARQDLGAYAATTALDELYGLGYANFELEEARFAAVTVAQTRLVAARYLTPANLVISWVMPEGEP
jgi:zinc protease